MTLHRDFQNIIDKSLELHLIVICHRINTCVSGFLILSFNDVVLELFSARFVVKLRLLSSCINYYHMLRLFIIAVIIADVE